MAKGKVERKKGYLGVKGNWKTGNLFYTNQDRNSAQVNSPLFHCYLQESPRHDLLLETVLTGITLTSFQKQRLSRPAGPRPPQGSTCGIRGWRTTRGICPPGITPRERRKLRPRGGK